MEHDATPGAATVVASTLFPPAFPTNDWTWEGEAALESLHSHGQDWLAGLGLLAS